MWIFSFFFFFLKIVPKTNHSFSHFNMVHKERDEVVIQLDENGQQSGSLDLAPVDMVARMRFICRWFLIIFLVRLNPPFEVVSSEPKSLSLSFHIQWNIYHDPLIHH
jgi:hypothetical protein